MAVHYSGLELRFPTTRTSSSFSPLCLRIQRFWAETHSHSLRQIATMKDVIKTAVDETIARVGSRATEALSERLMMWMVTLRPSARTQGVAWTQMAGSIFVERNLLYSSKRMLNSYCKQ
jgi:hypothetical protein